MITIFNRCEIFKIRDNTAYQNVCDVLQENGIKYKTDIKYIGATGRSNQSNSIPEYSVYVAKADAEKAKAVLAANYNKIFVN